MTELERLRRGEFWFAWIRLVAVPFAALQASVADPYPAGREVWAWASVGVLAAGATLIFAVLLNREVGLEQLRRIGAVSVVFDFAVLASLALSVSAHFGTPIRQVTIVVVVEATLRYGLRGGIGVTAANIPVLLGCEWLRQTAQGDRFRYENVLVLLAIEAVVAVTIGWLIETLRGLALRAEERASEAESLRDELGRRADLLDAANRCARALGSSLDVEEAFAGFIRELRGLVPFDRVAIALDEGGRNRTIAVAGVSIDDPIIPDGTSHQDTIFGDVVRSGDAVYYEDVAERRYVEDEHLLELGLRSGVAAPLLVGTNLIGLLILRRRAPRGFTYNEVELISVLGRLVGTAVQNIRAYEAERKIVDELRRLSALRADFVSLVSHELRSPMAAVIGAARTLQARWRELTTDQRSAFLALIADETNRLAALIGDVLDTSRIDAGTFSYSFADVDLGALVRDTAASFEVAQDEVSVEAETADPLPAVRGDGRRLKQVLVNLIDNAVKYSSEGGKVEVRAWANNGMLHVAVADRGPGIPTDQQGLIFEKFGRADVGDGKPGSGLGLFIARSIAEAHGGRLAVQSSPGRGATFTLEIPVAVE